MILEYINEIQLDSTKDKDVAKAMYRFWRYQERQALIKYNAAKEAPGAMRRRNKEDRRVWNDDPMEGLGFGFKVTYSEASIIQAEGKIPAAQKNYLEAKAMLDYFEKYLFDKAHPTEK